MEHEPVYIDQQRMDRALAGPRYAVPGGLNAQQVCEFFNTVAIVAEDAALAERERCAKLVENTPAEAFCTVMHQGQLQRARETFAAAIRRDDQP